MLASAASAAAAVEDKGGETLAVPAPTPSQTARPGGVPSPEVLRRNFPDLEILDVLGAGGMGVVYKARQPRLNRLVALKIMVAAPGHEGAFALRFEREAQVLARLSHRHIVSLHDFGELGPERTGADPLFYFLMEYVDGTDLGQLIKSKELQPAQALAIVPQICEALQYAHNQGITHRDIKPANILIDKRGAVKIADFGLAKMVGGDAADALMTGLTQTGTAMGTPHYMAPEQWEHPEQVDHRADIYALGVVFYEMLTGERPAGVFEPPSRKTSPPVDKKLDGVVMRAMDKNPDRRYQHAGQIGDDVTRIVGTDTAETKSTPLKPLLAVAAVLALGGWLHRHGSPPAAVPPRTAPGASSASSQATTASAPGWVKVDFDSDAAAKSDPLMELRSGRLHLRQGDSWRPLPSRIFRRVAQRVSFTCPEASGPVSYIKLNFLPVTSVSSISNRFWYYLKLGISPTGGQYWGIGRYQSGDVHFTGPGRIITPVLKPGTAAVLQFAILGESFYAWLNGRLLGAVRPPDTMLEDGCKLMVTGENFTLDGYEYLPLDDLSEADALKMLGVDGAVPMIEAVPQAAFSWGSSRYAFVNENMPWPEARKRAEVTGGRLAVFETEAEERAVREHFRARFGKGGCWIGGHAEEGSKELRWVTGQPVGKLAWETGHPGWRSDPASKEGVLWAAGLGVKHGTERWMTIQPQDKSGLGFIIEWDDATRPDAPDSH